MSRAAGNSPRSGRPFLSLRRSHRFAGLYRTGRRRRVGGIVVISGPGEADLPEVGFVAGRRVGNAVQRNRAKRRLRAAAAQVPLRPRTAYVVVAGPEAVDAEFTRLVGWLAGAVGAADAVGAEEEDDDER